MTNEGYSWSERSNFKLLTNDTDILREMKQQKKLEDIQTFSERTKEDKLGRE